MKVQTKVYNYLKMFMFGSIYRNHPDILLKSLTEMNDVYKRTFAILSGLKMWMAKLYIGIFGIPEIGFQVRGMYFRNALKSLHDFMPQTILDIGSGIGCYVFYSAKKYPNSWVSGWEIDRSKLRFSKEFLKESGLPNAEFSVGDITQPVTKRKAYDFISIIDVLEHIKEYKTVLKNIHTLLKPNGYAYIHVPQIKQARFFHTFELWEHEDHVREGFEPASLAKELRDAGFQIIYMKNTFGFFGSLAWELNHLLLSKNQLFSALWYPFLYVFAYVDCIVPNTRGLGIAFLVKKI